MLVEITIEERNGAQEYNHEILVLVDDMEQAESYARMRAATWYPETQKSFGKGLYETPVGYPMWEISDIREVTGLTVRDLRNNNERMHSLSEGYTRLEYTEVGEGE